MNYCFEYINQNQLENLLPRLFAILHANMSQIAPTGNTYEDDYKIWFSNICPALEESQRQLILMYSDEIIVGYFQYSVMREAFMMEDIQINKAYHGTGIFSTLYTWLIRHLPSDIKTVEAYADKKNFKSQEILEHLGLMPIGENKNGKSYHYKGEYKKLLEKYT